MIFYFVIYPYVVAKRYNFDGTVTEKPTFIKKKSFELYKIRDVGEVFTDTFVFYRKFFKYFSKIYLVIFPISVTYLAWFFYQYSYGGTINDWYENMAIAFNIGSRAFSWESFGVLTFLFSINITSLFYAFSFAKQGEKPKNSLKAFFTYTIKNIWRVIPIIGGALLLIQVDIGIIVLAGFIMPFILSLSFPGAF